MSNAYIEALDTLHVLQEPLPPVSRNPALALIVPDTNVLMDMWVFELMIGAFPTCERGVKPIQPGGLIYCSH